MLATLNYASMHRVGTKLAKFQMPVLNGHCIRVHSFLARHAFQSRQHSSVLTLVRLNSNTALYCLRLGIPAKVNAHSEGKMNSIPG